MHTHTHTYTHKHTHTFFHTLACLDIFGNFKKIIFNIGLHSDIYEQIPFKVDVMLDVAKLCMLIPF